ncbi:CZB domain-containing protein [Thiomicrorhabdus sp. Kp2]|uniref:CZB domain-containing protein n=1 Tax=Thiomicrorhabdus sp. Kp2 TaxID=1123518 RepID=UPI0003FAAE5D|nr:CZB domain-containing protein [Thiomicrorhabdus sp. Kp2]
MTKKEIITQLRAAKAAHIQWRAYAQAIVGGFSVDQNHVPVIHTNCKFGQWYYGKGQMLSSLGSFGAIDAPHAMLHQIYMEIFKLMFSETKKGFLGGIFTSKEKLRQKNEKQAKELMQSMIAVSETLLETINILEKEVMDLTDEEVAELY